MLRPAVSIRPEVRGELRAQAIPLRSDEARRRNLRACAVSLAVAVVGCAYGAPLASQSHDNAAVLGRSAACTTSIWGPPFPLLTASGAPVYVEKPDAAPVRGGTALFGVPTYVWAAPDTFARVRAGKPAIEEVSNWAGILLQRTGSGLPIPMPPDTRRWIAPRVLAGPAGLAHVVWGSVPDSVIRPSQLVTALWYARFDGGQWSTPERIVSADAIWWDGSSNSAVVVNDVIHIAAPAYDNTHASRPWRGALYARRAAGKWTSMTLTEGFDFVPRYLALDAEGSDHIALYYAGGVALRDRTESNGVGVVRSADGGLKWSAPDLLVSLDGSAGHWIRLMRGTHGDRKLVWADLNQPAGQSRLTTMHSPNGLVWTSGGSLTLPWQLLGFALALRDQGVEIIAQGAQGQKLSTATWRDGRWSPLAVLPFGPAISLAAIVPENNDSTLLSWGEARRTVTVLGGDMAPALMASQRLSRCR